MKFGLLYEMQWPHVKFEVDPREARASVPSISIACEEPVLRGSPGRMGESSGKV